MVRMDAPVGLLPLPRPLMTAEVLDGAFRLFRAGILHCLPYSGLAVLVIELPTLYSTFFAPARGAGAGIPNFALLSYAFVFVLSVPLLGVMTLRLNALATGARPRFRTELAAALKGWPMGLFATAFAFGYPLLLLSLQAAIVNSLPTTALVFAAVPLLWPAGLFVVALPAFWSDRLSPVPALVQSVRLSARHSWRMFGAILATVCMVAVFLALAAVIVWVMLPLFGGADLFLIATVESTLYLVVGAFGVPFVLAVLIVAHQDLKLRDREHGVGA
jgi:hypothetical protein